MYKKNFVSIAISPKSLQIVELTTNKKKALKFSEIALPDGLIEKSKVVKVDDLAIIIKTAWKKLGISERAVGLVVPEFSTYSKILKLPILPLKELDESIRWQAQDYLGLEAKDSVLDWKIVNKDENNYEILAVSIPLDILGSYIDPLDKAGLLPVIVKTPSLALIRAVQKEDITRLIIYKSDVDIITLAQGEKIVTSSIVRTDEALLQTTDMIVKHYGDANIQKIYLADSSGTTDIKGKLQETFKKETIDLTIPIESLTHQDVARFLLPISLQMSDPKEPSDEFSINLLPPAWVQKYENKRKELQFSSLSLIASLVIWSCFFASIMVFGMLAGRKLIQERADIQLGRGDLPQDVQAGVTQINALSTKVTKITDSEIPPQKIINEIQKLKSNDIVIANYNIDLDSLKIDLAGTALTRSALIKFKQDLEDSPNFANVQLPISSFQSQTNIDYNLEFTYALKVEKKLGQ